MMWPDIFIETPMHILFYGVAQSLLESLRNGERALWSDGFVRSMILGTSWAVEIEEATVPRRQGGRRGSVPSRESNITLTVLGADSKRWHSTGVDIDTASRAEGGDDAGSN